MSKQARSLLSPYQRHRADWIRCDRCPLHERRSRVVLLRGTIPAEVLFIGEAPGVSEDVIGRPFVGPAGKLLDRMIAEAWNQAGEAVDSGGFTQADQPIDVWRPCPLRYAITNLVGCIPRDEAGGKVGDPPLKSIRACAPRLQEVASMCRPSLVVCVGQVAAKHFRLHTRMPIPLVVEITHPAAILRANVAQQGLLYQRAVVTLVDALGELA